MATKRRARSKQRSPAPRKSPEASELLLVELQEIYSAEQQMARMGPRFVKAAQAEMLKACLHRRLETGSQLIEDLDATFEQLDLKPGRKKNAAAEGLLGALHERVQEMAAGPARDASLIAGFLKVEHYCIAAWGTSRALADALELRSVAEVMSRALDEGRDLDRQLSELAEQEILPELLADEDAEHAIEEDESKDEIQHLSRRSRRTPGSERRAPH